jgi:hypothetical protein
MAKQSNKAVETVALPAGPKPVPARGFDPLDDSNNFNVDRPAYAVDSAPVKAVSFSHYAGHQDIIEGAGPARLMFPKGKE